MQPGACTVVQRLQLSPLQCNETAAWRPPASPARLQRLLAHRTAQHWGLETSTINHGPDQGRIVAIRTPATRQPQVRLSSSSRAA